MLRQKKIETDGKRPSWEAIVLKFPVIDKQFRRIEKIMRTYDVDKNQCIDFSELVPLLNDLGVQDNDEIHTLFESCKTAGSSSLSFSQVLVCLTIGYVLKLFGEPHTEENSDNPSTNKRIRGSRVEEVNFQAAFDYAVYAFLEFDRDGSGEIEHAEIAAKFRSKGYKHRSGIKRLKSLATTRMQQLDADKNGSVSFNEFLTGFMTWIRTDDNDEEDDAQAVSSVPY